MTPSERRQWLADQIRTAPRDRCLDWPGSTVRGNYGIHFEAGKHQMAGHLALELDGRPRPFADAQQLHACDRPICVAPWHLHWGTISENQLECSARGRKNSPKGEAQPRHKLTDAAVRQARVDWASGVTTYVLADRYGVAQPVMWRALVRKTWKHVA